MPPSPLPPAPRSAPLSLAALAALCTLGPGACDGATLAPHEATRDARPDAIEETAPSPPLEPTPWVFEGEPTPVTASLTPEALASAIVATAEAVIALDAGRVQALYATLAPYERRRAGDPSGCPYVVDYGDYLVWAGDCEAADGTRFHGNGAATPSSGGSSYLYLVGRVEAPDGTWLEGAGIASVEAYLEDRRVTLAPFRVGGPRAPTDPWFDGTRGYDLVYEVARGAGGGAMVHIEGSLRAPDLLPDGVDALALEPLTFTNAAAGAYCDLEPGGAVGVRTPEGQWYDIHFDGRTRDEAEAELAYCDGCGATTFRDAAVAPTCVDPARVLGDDLGP